jgi:hypothetical protein
MGYAIKTGIDELGSIGSVWTKILSTAEHPGSKILCPRLSDAEANDASERSAGLRTKVQFCHGWRMTAKRPILAKDSPCKVVPLA